MGFQIVTAIVASAGLSLSLILALIRIAEFRATSRARNRPIQTKSAGVAARAPAAVAGKQVYLVWGWLYNPSTEARHIQRCVLEFGPANQRRRREALGAQWRRALRAEPTLPPSAIFTPLTIAPGDEKEGCFLFPLESGDMDAMFFTEGAEPAFVDMWDDLGRSLPPFEAGGMP